MAYPRRYIATLAASLVLGAATQPVRTFSNVEILTKTVNVTRAPPSPIVQMDFTGGRGNVTLTWTGPSGETFTQNFYGYLEGTQRLQGINTAFTTYSDNPAFGLYTEPGTWTLTGVSVCNPTGCDTVQAGNFGTFTMVNPNTPDITPPVAVSGTVDTPTLSLSSGKFQTASVTLNVTDDVSGIKLVEVTATGPGGRNLMLAAPRPPGPVLSATLTGSDTFKSKRARTGTYTISYIELLDVAGNSAYITDTATISHIFGGAPTITITQ